MKKVEISRDSVVWFAKSLLLLRVMGKRGGEEREMSFFRTWKGQHLQHWLEII